MCNPVYPIWPHVTTDKRIHSTIELMQLKNAHHNLQAASMSLFLCPKCAISSKFLALICYRLILTCSCSRQPLNLDWSISVWCWGKTWIWGLWCSNCWARCARMWTCLQHNIFHVHKSRTPPNITTNTVGITMTTLQRSWQNVCWGIIWFVCIWNIEGKNPIFPSSTVTNFMSYTFTDLLRITKVNLNILTTPYNFEYKTLAVLKMNYKRGKKSVSA